MKFQYSPGIYGYGLKGTDASAGIPGIAIYFTNYNAISDQTTIEYDISNNFVLWSNVAPGTLLPGERSYNEGDLIITQYGDLYEISFNPIKYLRRGTLNLNKYFNTRPNALSSNFQYQRYSNINDNGNSYLIDNAKMEPIINYSNITNGIYGINSKDFNRIEYTNIKNEEKNAYTFYSSAVSIDDNEYSIAIVRENSTNTFRLGNYTNEDGIRQVNLSLDVKELKKSNGQLLSNASLGNLISNEDISINSLFNPTFNYDPSTFTMIAVDPCTIKISWKINGFTSDSNVTCDLHFYEVSRGFTDEYVFNAIDASGSVNIQKLNYMSRYGACIKTYKNGWERSSILKSILCDGISKYLVFKSPSSLTINASSNGLIGGLNSYTTDFSTNSTIGWTTNISNTWITCMPSSSTNINVSAEQHFDVSLSNYTLDISRTGYIDVISEAPTQRIIIIQDASLATNVPDASVYLSNHSLVLSNIGSKVIDVSIKLSTNSYVNSITDPLSSSGIINLYDGTIFKGQSSSYARCLSAPCTDSDSNDNYISLIGLTSTSVITFNPSINGWEYSEVGSSRSQCTLEIMSIRKTSGVGNINVTSNRYDMYFDDIGMVTETYTET